MGKLADAVADGLLQLSDDRGWHNATLLFFIHNVYCYYFTRYSSTINHTCLIIFFFNKSLFLKSNYSNKVLKKTSSEFAIEITENYEILRKDFFINYIHLGRNWRRTYIEKIVILFSKWFPTCIFEYFFRIYFIDVGNKQNNNILSKM